MAIERIIVEELANISMTLTELSAITSIINSEIKNEVFSTLFNKIVSDIDKCYETVIINIQPFIALNSEENFVNEYDQLQGVYTASYLIEVGKPRVYVENAYEAYLELKMLKESKTQFPILKRTFKRLDELIDKWITNDAWLAMYIDNLFKRLQSLLTEIAELKKKDPNDAYLIYNSAFTNFEPYFELLKKKSGQLATQS